MFADSLIATVRRALCDPLPEVRESASKTFDNLHSNIGNRALDEIIPDLLKKLVCLELNFYSDWFLCTVRPLTYNSNQTAAFCPFLDATKAFVRCVSVSYLR